jgi:hypothetical protein
MSVDGQTDHGLPQLRIRVRKAPLCYSRGATVAEGHQARVDARSSTALMMLGAVTCAVAFLVVYGGWGI